jgi:hypothetical protein
MYFISGYLVAGESGIAEWLGCGLDVGGILFRLTIPLGTQTAPGAHPA